MVERDTKDPGCATSSLADLPELVGFFSYSREDDEGSNGALSKLRDRIQQELAGLLGRSRADFRVWQDKSAILHGKFWMKEITSAIGQSVFFVPIVTPRAIRSQHCKLEFESFLGREKELGRDDLVFPILYIRVPALANEQERRANEALEIIHARQYADWTDIRQEDVSSPLVGKRIEHFCQDIAGALLKSWTMPGKHGDQTTQEQEPAAGSKAVGTSDRPGLSEALPITEAAVPFAPEVDAAPPRPELHIAQAPTGKPHAAPAEPPTTKDEQPWAQSLASKWRSIGVVADGRARFAVGCAILMNALLILSMIDMQQYSVLHYFRVSTEGQILHAIFIVAAAVGLFTMWGIRQAKWVTIALLFLNTTISIALLIDILHHQNNYATTIYFAPLALTIAGVLGIIVCWTGWKPLRASLTIRGSAADWTVLLLLAVCPFWSISLHFSVSKMLTSNLVWATAASIYVLCLLFCLLCSRWWAEEADALPKKQQA